MAQCLACHNSTAFNNYMSKNPQNNRYSKGKPFNPPLKLSLFSFRLLAMTQKNVNEYEVC